MKKFLIIIAIFLFYSSVVSAEPSKVIINEIAWMGTEVSSSDEWIELYNNTDQDINLDGWVLKADDGAPEINLTGQIPTQGFYLLERTNDETVPGIPADLIYTGALENSGEYLKLFDNSGNLIDEVNCQDGWPAGDNGAKLTMERTENKDWQTSAEKGGTPMNYEEKLESGKLNQNQGAKLPEQTLPEENEGAKLTEYPTGIVFTKIMPSPEGPDAKNEWIVPTNKPKHSASLLQLIS